MSNEIHVSPAQSDPAGFPEPKAPANHGKLGFKFSLIAPLVVLSMMIFSPGWGSPVAALGGLCILFAPPVALILSVVGVVSGRGRGYGIAGIVLCGLLFLVMFVLPLAISLCR